MNKKMQKISNSMWVNINRRCKRGNYANRGIKVSILEHEFKTWANLALENFFWDNPNQIPSIDRINPDGDYEKGNLKISILWKNRASSRYFLHCLGIEDCSEKEKNMEKIEFLLDVLLNQTSIEKTEFKNFMNQPKLLLHEF